MVERRHDREPQLETSWRILVVAHGYPPAQITGAEQQMRRKVNWWREHGHTLSVVAADPRLAPDWPFDRIEASTDLVDDIEIHRLRFAVADASRTLEETYRHQLLMEELEQHVQRFRPDLIYQLSGMFFGLAPIELAAKHQLPSVLFATDFWHLCQRHTLLRPDGSCCPGPRHPADCAACRLTARRPFAVLGSNAQRLHWRALALAGRRAAALPGVREFSDRRDAIESALATIDLVICNSQFLTDQMRRLGLPRERLLTIRQGLEASPAIRPHDGNNDALRPLRILYLGQVTRHKGVDLLISAARRLLDDGILITLSIHGPRTDGVIGAGSAPVEGIHFGPSLAREGVADALVNADVLVVPSRWYENSPNVILEAQAMGLPVVTADHGGMAEMVRHEVDGLLFEPDNTASLASAIRRLAQDRGLLAELRANVRPPHSLAVEMTAEDAAIARVLRSHRDMAGLAHRDPIRSAQPVSPAAGKSHAADCSP